MKKIFLLTILILTMTIPCVYAASNTGYTNISNIALYKSDDYTSKVTATLKLSSKVEIIEEDDDWCKVKTEDGSTGWIEKYFITVPAEKYAVNNSSFNINIRTSPTTGSKQVGQLSPGSKAKYVSTYHSSHIIEYKGEEYYVASWLTDIEYGDSEKIYLLYDTINIRDDASFNGKVIAQGDKYDSYEVKSEKNGWLEILIPDGRLGYVAAWLTTYDANYYSEGNNGYKKTVDALNLRSGPSTKYKKILSLKTGTTVQVVATENDWDKVVDKDGKVGWCNNAYLKEMLPLSGKTILLDPGHGGKDPGSISFSGKYEKYINLDVAYNLKENLEALGATVYMTRSDDTYIKNNQRGRMADKLGADILLSIHHNSLNNSDYFGLSTYYNTINYKSTEYGFDLAKAIYMNAVTVNGVYRDGILDRNFEVLRETNTPAALIEIGFMSNPAEEMNLHNSSFQNIIVEKIANGIVDYFY